MQGRHERQPITPSEATERCSTYRRRRPRNVHQYSWRGVFSECGFSVVRLLLLQVHDALLKKNRPGFLRDSLRLVAPTRRRPQQVRQATTVMLQPPSMRATSTRQTALCRIPAATEVPINHLHIHKNQHRSNSKIQQLSRSLSLARLLGAARLQVSSPAAPYFRRR